MIKRVEAVAKFLQAANNLRKQGISKDQVIEFAKREFGEVSDLLKRQIEQIFTPQTGGITSIKKPEGEVIEASFKPGMDKRGKVVDESPSQASGTSIDQENFLQRIARRIQEDREQSQKKQGIEKLMDEGEGITFSVPEKGITRKKTSIDEITKMLTKNPRRPGGPLDPVEGMTRTAARVVLGNKKIPIPEKGDPIDIFEENFGGDALMDLRQAGEELLEKESRGGITESMGEFLESRGLFDLKVDKAARKGMTDEEFIKFLKDKGVDPDDTGFASGGRVQYAFGSGIKLAGFLAIRGKTLKDEIKKAIDNFIQPSGDRKLDADVILDDMLEELGASRDQFDQKDVIDAYGEIYDTLGKGPKTIDEALDIKSEKLAPKMMERFRLKEKYPFIDDDLVTKIVEDTDPQRKAEVLATLDQSSELMNKGKSSEEVVDILKQGMDRKKQAEGGLSYLMGM